MFLSSTLPEIDPDTAYGICNHMLNKVWDKITYPVPKVNGATAEVWELISNFISHYIISEFNYPCWNES